MVDTLAPDDEGLSALPDPFDGSYEPSDPEGPDYAQRATITTLALGELMVETVGRPLR